MIKRILALLLILVLSAGTLAGAKEAPASAAERIMFYHQSTAPEALERWPYNAIPCKSASFSVLGGNGCSIFAGLHAYQWLYGRFESIEEQTARAREMVALLQGASPAVKGNGPYVAYLYAHEKGGAYKAIDISRKQKEIIDFFDNKGGALYIHATWEGGGHYFIAVGYTYQEIAGKETFLLHIVDSGWGGTVEAFEAYTFETFEPAVATEENWFTAQEYWMPLQDGVNIAFGLWTRPETAK